MPRGLFFVIEGVDCAGKSTLVEGLVDHLMDQYEPAISLKFPCKDTTSFHLLDKYIRKEIELDERTAHLLFATNRSEMQHFIKNTLQEGVHVICDRYIPSGIAYSYTSGKLEWDWLVKLEKDIVQPDYVFLLDINTHQCLQRRNEFGVDRFDNVEKLEMIRKNYLRLFNPLTWYVVNANQTKENVLYKTIQIMMECIKLKSKSNKSFSF